MGYLLSIGNQVKEKLGDKNRSIAGNIWICLVILTRTVFCQWHIWAVGKHPPPTPRAYGSKGLKRHNRAQTSFKGASAQRRTQGLCWAFVLIDNGFWNAILMGPHLVLELGMFLILSHWVWATAGTLKWTRPMPGLTHRVKVWLVHCLLSGSFVLFWFGFNFNLLFIFI